MTCAAPSRPRGSLAPMTTAGDPDDLLARAIAAHGGAARWRSISAIEVEVDAWGWMFPVRGLSNIPRRLRIDARAQRVELVPTATDPRRGLYTPDRVELVTADGRTETREHPRDRLGLLRVRWDWLDLLYFAGYAWWNYLTLPFLLAGPGFVLRELSPCRVRGETWRRLHATFPPELHTHSRRQVFWFDPRGLLRRHDYHADVMGFWAYARHTCDDHKAHDGLVVPMRRRARPRLPWLDLMLPVPPVIALDLRAVRVS